MKSRDIKILLVLSLTLFTGALNFGILSPALPSIKAYFGAGEREITWILSIFVLFYMIGALFLSKSSDRFGRKTIYIINMFIFLIGTLLAIFSNSFIIMIAGRAIQGFSAGGFFPMSSAIIGDLFSFKTRGAALGIISAFFGFSFIFGPFLGGLILQYGWQWLLIIQIPLIIIMIILSFIIVPKIEKTGLKSFDLPGIILLGLSLAFLALGISQLDVNQLLDSLKLINIWPLFLLSVITFIFWLKNEKDARYPLINSKIFENMQISLTILIAIFSGFIEIGTVFISSMAILLFNFSSYMASLMIIPILIAIIIGSPAIGFLIDKLGSRTVVILSGALSAFGLFTLSLSSNFYLFIFGVIMIGFGFSILIGAPLRYIMLNEIGKSDRATGQALINVSKSSGRLICSALFGAIIASKGGTIVGYQLAFLFIGIVAILVIILSLRLKKKFEEKNKN